MLDLIISTLTQGFIYAMLSYGIYITYKILDFPDLTVDGSFPLGAAVTALLLVKGVNPYLTLLAALAVGAESYPCVWKNLNAKPKLCFMGCPHMTLHQLIDTTERVEASLLAHGQRKVCIPTVFTAAPTMALFGSLSLIMRKLIVSIIIMLICKILLDLYFKTKNGFLLRAVGDNSALVTTLAKDMGRVKIIGLVISNALVALSGAVVCHEQRSFSAMMGTGQMVFGLAAVIIGTTLFRKMSFVKGTTAVTAGSVIYKACIQIAISLGLPASLLKLITAVLFLVILVIGNFEKGSVKKNVRA